MKAKTNMKVKTTIRAGSILIEKSGAANHNPTLATKNLRVKSKVKVGLPAVQYR